VSAISTTFFSAGSLAVVVQEAGRGPIILGGHSIGGMIIQTFGRLHAKQLGPRVSGIVLLQTTYTNPLSTALGAPFWKAIEKPVLAPINQLTIWLAPLAWLSNWQSFLNGSLHLMTRVASFSGKQTWGQLNYGAFLAAQAWPGVVARGNLAMTHFDEQATLPQIDVPVVVIAGHHDRMTKPSASGRIEQLVKHSLPFTVDAGHLGLWETHGDVTEVLREFAARFTKQNMPANSPSRSPTVGTQE
jgi:pimeloyl-ACP methyl ester carboxylesterase